MQTNFPKLCRKGDTCPKSGPWVVAPFWRTNHHGEPALTWLVALRNRVENEPGERNPGGQGQTTRPTNKKKNAGNKRQGRPNGQETRRQRQKADRPGSRTTFVAAFVGAWCTAPVCAAPFQLSRNFLLNQARNRLLWCLGN